MRAKRKRKPTTAEVTALRVIAQDGGLMVTYRAGRDPIYSTFAGKPIAADLAKRLIDNSRLTGNRDSLYGDPQSYSALKP